MNQRTDFKVIDTLAASGADITLDNGLLTLTGYDPKIKWTRVRAARIKRYINEVGAKPKATFTTVSPLTEYGFTVVQTVAGIRKSAKILYKTGASATVAEVYTSLTALVNAHVSANGLVGLATTITSSPYGVQFAAGTGAPIATFEGAVNVTLGDNNGSATTAANDGTVFNQNISSAAYASGVITVTFAASIAAGAIAIGDKVRITGFGTVNGSTSPQVARVVSKSGADLGLTVTSATISLSGATIERIPSYSESKTADLQALGLTAASASNYTELEIEYIETSAPVAPSPTQENPVKLRYFVLDSATNYAAWLTKAGETIAGYTPGATTANPEINAV